MTTYILKDTYDQLIKRKLTKQIILIMKQTKKKEFTKKDIIEISMRYFGCSFKCDSKGHTVLRYLKTMAKYDIVTEILQGSGLSSLWVLNEIPPELSFHVVIDNHINKLKEVARREISALTYKNATVYGFFGHDWIKKEGINGREKKELFDIVEQFHDITQKLADHQEKVFNKIADMYVKKAVESCNSYIDKWIVHTFHIIFMCFFFGSFNIRKDGFINFELFEKDKYPYVLKPTIIVLKGIHQFSQYYADHKPSEKEVWKEIGNYQLSDDLCQALTELFNVYFEYKLGKGHLFSVFCDLGSPHRVLSEMFETEKKFQRKISDRAFLEKFFRERIEEAERDGRDLLPM